MNEIQVEHLPPQERLTELGITKWPIWTKEVSEFPWSYSDKETCYFLAGEVEVTPEGQDPVRMGEGDLVVFPEGMSCTWKVIRDVRKHYKFG